MTPKLIRSLAGVAPFNPKAEPGTMAGMPSAIADALRKCLRETRRAGAPTLGLGDIFMSVTPGWIGDFVAPAPRLQWFFARGSAFIFIPSCSKSE